MEVHNILLGNDISNKEEYDKAKTKSYHTINQYGKLSIPEYTQNYYYYSINNTPTEILNLMKLSNQELKDLIENMLETYRLDQKELKLNKSNHNLNEFLISVINEMSPIVYSSSHKIVFDIEIAKIVVDLKAETEKQTAITNAEYLISLYKNLNRLRVFHLNQRYFICIVYSIPSVLIRDTGCRNLIAPLKGCYSLHGSWTVYSVRHNKGDSIVVLCDHAKHGLQTSHRLTDKYLVRSHLTTS